MPIIDSYEFMNYFTLHRFSVGSHGAPRICGKIQLNSPKRPDSAWQQMNGLLAYRLQVRLVDQYKRLFLG